MTKNTKNGVRYQRLRVTLAAAACLSSASVWAGVSEILGDVRQIPVPPSVEPAAIAEQDEEAVNFFFEQQDVVLDADVFADGSPRGEPVAVQSGTCVRSYYVMFNPRLRNPPVSNTGRGTMAFSTPILGVAISQTTLDGSNQLGAATTTYPVGQVCNGDNDGDCGLEDNDQIEVRRFELDVELHAAGVGDRLRVITLGNDEACRASRLD